VCILFLFCGLSGCVTDDTINPNNGKSDQYTVVSGDIDKVNLSAIEVTTHWEITEEDANASTTFNESGFYHAYPINADRVFYTINAVVENIAQMMLDEVRITVRFYDDAGIVVDEQTEIIIDFFEDKKTQLEVFVEKDEVPLFDDISSVRFQVDVQ